MPVLLTSHQNGRTASRKGFDRAFPFKTSFVKWGGGGQLCSSFQPSFLGPCPRLQTKISKRPPAFAMLSLSCHLIPTPGCFTVASNECNHETSKACRQTAHNCPGLDYLDRLLVIPAKQTSKASDGARARFDKRPPEKLDVSCSGAAKSKRKLGQSGTSVARRPLRPFHSSLPLRFCQPRLRTVPRRMPAEIGPVLRRESGVCLFFVVFLVVLIIDTRNFYWDAWQAYCQAVIGTIHQKSS